MVNLFSSDRTLRPIFAALFLGSVVLISLLWTQNGLHVSGVYSLLCPSSTSSVSIVNADDLFCSTNHPPEKKKWMIWMVFGIFGGAFLTSIWRRRRFQLQVERGPSVSIRNRMLLASAGGLIVGFGAALAGGCTSSIGLTGSAVLSVAAFSFLGVFFVGGFVARLFFGRFWHD